MAGKFAGNFTLVSMENMEKYMEAVGAPPEAAKMFKEKKVSKTEMKVNGDKIEMSTEIEGHKEVVKCKLGEEFEYTSPFGQTLKIRIELKNGKMVETHKHGSKTSTITKEMKGDEMHVTLECGGVVGKTVFKKE